ncbi:MAG: glycoside hydrolase family 16 protein [Gordonia amarae]
MGRRTVYGLAVSEVDRRSMMLMSGFGILAAAVAAPKAFASPNAPLPAEPPRGNTGGFLWSDEFDGPAGSAPDPSKWMISNARETIKNPVFWDRPENMGQYRNSRDYVFLDGNSNLVIRAIRNGNKYTSGKVTGLWQGGIGTTWEARIKFDCLTDGAWPAWWLHNEVPGGEVDLIEWYGNRDWPSGTTVHGNLYGDAFETQPYPVDSAWHTWRCTWDQNGMYFWQDYATGKEPYFTVPAFSLDPWPFNLPDFTMAPVLNLAVAGSGGGDPAGGSYPAQMLVDWVRVF